MDLVPPENRSHDPTISINDTLLGPADFLSLEDPTDLRFSPGDNWKRLTYRLVGDAPTLYTGNNVADMLAMIPIIPTMRVTADTSLGTLFFDVLDDDPLRLGYCVDSPVNAHQWIKIIQAIAIPGQRLWMADFDILVVVGRGFLGKAMLVCRSVNQN
jgi:hypothetical protein